MNKINPVYNIKIEIISGQKEAKLITNNTSFSTKSKTFCFIDVGGGSTELTLINNNKIINSKSFKIGGVRLINNLVNKSTWNKFEKSISIHDPIPSCLVAQMSPS